MKQGVTLVLSIERQDLENGPIEMTKDSFTLVFHPVDGGTEAQSSAAFADAIEEVLSASSSEIRLVSPYIGYSILKKITQGRKFRLLTDIDALFEGGCDEQLVRFFEEYASCVRNISGIHAKVVSTDGAALIGSANFTQKGIGDRDELGCLIHEPSLLISLYNWFESLWSAANTIDLEHAKSLIAYSQKVATVLKSAELTPVSATSSRRNPGPRRTLGWLSSPIPHEVTGSTPSASSIHTLPEEKLDVDALIAQLRRLMQSQEDAQLVLELLAEALYIADLPMDDSRLYVNYRSATSLHVNISSYAVAWCNKKRGAPYFGMLLDDCDFAERMVEVIPGSRIEKFKFARGIKVPLTVLVDSLPLLRSSWHRAIRLQVQRKRKGTENPYYSPYLRYHSPRFYEILMSTESRRAISRSAFPISGIELSG